MLVNGGKIMYFNEKLKEIRKQNNLSQEDLANQLNVSRQAITKWETAQGLPDMENLKNISKFFHVSLDELLQEEAIQVSNQIIEEEKYVYEAIYEYDIDSIKDIEINVSLINNVKILPNDKDNILLRLGSNTLSDLDNFYRIKHKNAEKKFKLSIGKNSINIGIINIGIIKTSYKDLTAIIYLPQKYIKNVKINCISEKLDVKSLIFNKIDISQIIENINIENCKGDIELNTILSNYEITYNQFEGNLKINSISSIVKLNVPKNSNYQIKNSELTSSIEHLMNNQQISHNDVGKTAFIEVNGIDCKLILNEYTK